MNTDLIQQFGYIGVVKVGIYLLFIVLAALLCLRMFRVRSLTGDKGIKQNLSNIEALRAHDRYVINANRFLKTIVAVVERSLFRSNHSRDDYVSYNLQRAKIMAPGNQRYLKPDEWNAMIMIVAGALIAITLLVALFVNSVLGAALTVVVVIMVNTVPMAIVRSKVSQKDDELNAEFPGFYLMMHYTLMEGGKSPLDELMRVYEKTTDSEELKRFIDISCAYMSDYDEYDAMQMIAHDYREVVVVGKFTRLVRQLHGGGDIKQELEGFKNELMGNQRYALEKKRDKLVARAQRSFNILLIILVQAVLSAMAIYLPDISIAGSLFGGA